MVKGSKHSLESRRKMSATAKANTSHQGRFKKGMEPYKYWTGKKRTHSEKTKKKMSETRKGRRPKNFGISFKVDGAGNVNWKGGVSLKKGYRRPWTRLASYRKRGAGGRHTENGWRMLKALFRNTCLSCKRQEPEVKLTRDHVVPISQGGTNELTNIQPLCSVCNSKKFTLSTDFRNITSWELAHPWLVDKKDVV